MRRIFGGENRIIRPLCALLLLCLTLSGCKASPVIEQIIYTDDAELVDMDSQMSLTNNDKDNPEKDDELASKEKDENADTERDREQNEALSGDGADDSTAPDTDYDKNASSDRDTDMKNSSGQGDGSAGMPEEGESETEAGGAYPTAGNGGVRQIVDGRGRLVDVPENVDRVSAVGEAAVLVEMLGGQDRLAATSQSLSAGDIRSRVFPEQAQVLWSGDGGAELSESGFQALLAAGPEVCFEISGQNTFSESQIEALAAQGIAYVALPQMTTTDGLKQAVQVVGSVLGDKSSEGGTNAPELADEYIAFADGAVSEVSAKIQRFTYNGVDYDNNYYLNGEKKVSGSSGDSAANGKYTLFISDWDDSVYYRLASESYVTLEGNGSAVAYSGYSYSPLCYYMSLAGVVNSAATVYDSGALTRWYVNTLKPVTRVFTYSGGTGTPLARNTNLTAVDGDMLGSERFPAIVVASSDIKSKIEASPLWRYYGETEAAGGHNTGIGFLDESGNIISSNVAGSYDIYVNPSGVSDWTAASAESVLEVYWIAEKFQGAYSQAEVKSRIKEFYSTFYRYDLSDAEAEAIYAGR